jgi:hypothetical protein
MAYDSYAINSGYGRELRRWLGGTLVEGSYTLDYVNPLQSRGIWFFGNENAGYKGMLIRFWEIVMLDVIRKVKVLEVAARYRSESQKSIAMGFY